MRYLPMDMDRILDVIRSLARSQGFYRRLYRDLMEIQDQDPDRYDEITAALENEKFRSPLGVVLYFEQ